MLLCRSSADGNTSACWQVFLKNINSCSVNVQPITNCLCWPKKLMGKKIHTYVHPLNTATQHNIFIPPYGFLRTSLGMALLKPSRNIVLYQRKGEEVKKKRG